MQFEDRNIGAIIIERAKRAPDAVSFEQDGLRHTNGDIVNSVHALAEFFKRQSIGKGASVAIVAVDRLRGFEAMIALWSRDAVVLFLDPRQTIEEIKIAQDKAGIDVVFTDSKSFARRGGLSLMPARGEIIAEDGELEFVIRSGDSDAVIFSSSGTTNFPRFRRVPHNLLFQGLVASGKMLGMPVPLPSVSVGSLAFGAILFHWIQVFIHGTFMLSLPLFYRTSDLHDALSRKDVEFVGVPPVVIGDLLEFHSEDHTPQGGCIYPHIKRMSSIGGPISADNLVRAYQMLTPHVRNIYSMSGVGVVSVLAGPEVLEKPRSVGKPFAQITLSINDETGEQCIAGQVGRIFAKSDLKHDAVLVDTGDMGWLDDDGFLYIAGRSDQIVTRKSINISLSELESDVKNIAGVRDCIAFSSLAEASLDDVVFLAVEARDDSDAVRNRIKSSLASFRRPDKILVSERLPRTLSDKIALGELKKISGEKGAGFVDL